MTRDRPPGSFREGERDGGREASNLQVPVSADPTPVEALFAALHGGDRERVDALIAPLLVRLTRLAKKRVRGDEAEDIVQETLVSLWERRDCIREASHLLPFASQVLRNKLGNAFLRRQRSRETPLAEPEEAVPARDRGPAGPEAGAREEEFERVLDEAVATCGAENETWGFILRALRSGRSPAEIRAELGDLQPATLHTRIFRARARLKSILRDDFGIEI